MRPTKCTDEKNKKKKRNPKTTIAIRSIAKPVTLEIANIGDVVLCKMKGYCEWPALITGFDGKLIVIKFFGDGTTHKAAIHNFFSFEYSHQLIMHNIRTKKTPLYAKSIREAEIYLGIPESNSIVVKSLSKKM